MASSDLLKAIQAGKKLKKADTNDRSAPLVAVDAPKGRAGGGGGGGGLGSPMSAPSLPSGGGPPQLGGLFAGGMPKLKPAGQSNLGEFQIVCTMLRWLKAVSREASDAREGAVRASSTGSTSKVCPCRPSQTSSTASATGSCISYIAVVLRAAPAS